MSTNISTQLEELAVGIVTRVSEMLYVASKDLEPSKREKIVEMIENQLPTVVVSTLMKTTVLHTPKGIDHLRENIEDYSMQFTQMFIRND
jgi:hypothetical protein